MQEVGPGVREAEAGDATAIAALQVRSWREAYRGTVPDAFLEQLTEDAWLARWVDALGGAGPDGVHHLVSTAAPDGPPHAVASCGPAFAPEPDHSGQLYVLYADPPSWGRGHGSALVRRVHELLAADGHLGALLWVAADNRRAIAFYEHHGWSRDGATAREEVHGVTFDEVRMVRRLPA